MYGKNNRILYSAKFSQGCEVVAGERTRQAAGVSNGGTKVRMTRRGNPIAKTYRAGSRRGEIDEPAASPMPWARQESCSAAYWYPKA